MSRASPKTDLAVVVEKWRGDEALSLVRCLGLLDGRRRVRRTGENIEIPVLQEVPGLQTVKQEGAIPFRQLPSLAELLEGRLSPGLIELLPRGWFILGQVIVVKIHPSLHSCRHMIGQALLEAYPRCQAVLADSGVEGQFRQPQREVIAGDCCETVHRENGVIFKLDPLRIMFSPGNLRERTRMSTLGRGENVVDMFAGIGYFSLPMAVCSRPKKVRAIELNPLAFRYLRENIALNRVGHIVEPVPGDCALVVEEGWADRAVMGMVGITDRYLRYGIGALRPGGTLHYHQTVPSWRFPDDMIRDVMGAARAQGREAEIQAAIRVKKYSPGVIHGVVDARIG
ncbi:MAG: tRNA wyosine derivatives biosynthesis protein Taw2 [Methanosaeta sp. PtaB.Bin039]|nr:MAG: tRNA wyosine derivatives biosynthesis protein Taw2 [Methanosaeta sp. PtaB.Bin039]OPY44614.1 MAG: tRNA wyosine derivatives biosynthesis protein Taw2 [Methanosaeta sp. PtaU1.Bin028]HOT06397.1 class I SAM-dependent methyltransferase family protein [Methanotrichaceae archaeon]HQF16168.1 class I SAM-dependent methyltransferase family protein [Methanotrichaceae archaeon]HQI90904.1 class I SAM-dependent methyltransferase family protein [Methanotrichaceae archaeon]